MAKAGKVSLRAGDMVEGGSLIDDVNGTIRNPRFALSDYDGKARDTALVCEFDLELDDETTHKQIYSAGDKKKFTPSKDGLSLVPTGTVTAMNVNSNFGLLAAAIEDCDADLGEALGEGSLEVLDGKRFHWARKPQPERKGLQMFADDDERGGRKRERTILLPDDLLAEAKGKGKTKPGAGKKATKPADDDEEDDDEDEAPAPKASKGKKPAADEDDDEDEAPALADKDLRAIVAAVVDDNGGSVKKSKLNALLFKHPKVKALSRTEAGKAIEKMLDDDFLENGKGKFTYDGETVSTGDDDE